MADFKSIKSVGLSLVPGKDFFLPPPLGVYALVFYPTNGFLASVEGTVTDYPHRAMLFTHAVYTQYLRLLLSQAPLTYLDFVHIPLLTEAESVPDDISGTPTGFRVTLVPAASSIAHLQYCIPQVWVGTNPLLNSYACSVDLGTGICQAIENLAGGATSPIPLYYESTPGTYSILFNVSNTVIALI